MRGGGRAFGRDELREGREEAAQHDRLFTHELRCVWGVSKPRVGNSKGLVMYTR